LGIALSRMGRLGDAIAAFKRKIEVQPKDVAGWTNLAATLCEQGSVREGLEASERALDLAPDDPDLNSNRLFFANAMPDESPRPIFELHRAWGTRLAARAAFSVRAVSNKPDPNRMLRIGYVSPDLFGFGGVASFIEPLLRSPDPKSLQ